MNAELEAKTAAVVRQAEEVMVSYLQMLCWLNKVNIKGWYYCLALWEYFHIIFLNENIKSS